MNSKELFVLIDNIDERFIDEAWGEKDDSDIYRAVDYSSDKIRGVNIVLERKPPRVFTPAIVTAACMLLFVAGGFTAANLFGNRVIAPSSRPELSASYSESSTSDDSGGEDYSFPQDVSIVETIMSYDFNFIIPLRGTATGTVAEKLNSRNFAEIMITYTNATEECPIGAQILKSPPKGGLEPISESITITGAGIYEIPYTTPWESNSFCYLYLIYPSGYDEDNMPSFIEISGAWSP